MKAIMTANLMLKGILRAGDESTPIHSISTQNKVQR